MRLTLGIGLELARNVAADVRVLPILRRRRSGIQQGRVNFNASSFVTEVVRKGIDRASNAEQWVAQETLPTVSDAVVILVGPPSGSPEAIIKVANGPSGAEALARERTLISAVRADPRLRDWRRVVPVPLGEGVVLGRRYLVESIVAGTEATNVLKGDDAKRRTLTSAAAAIAQLHRQTCTEPTPLDGHARALWIDKPLRTLRKATRARPENGRRRAALEHMGEIAHAACANKAVSRSWVHGDYVPQNIFVTPDGRRVTGIVDWELAVPDGVPHFDAIQLLLGTRVLVRRRELGQIVRELLIEPQLDEVEAAALDVAWRDIPGDVIDLRSLVLLSWLQHASRALEKSERYGRSWPWLTLNVENVLRAFYV